MLTDDFLAGITLEPFGAAVPFGDVALGVEHENRIVRYGFDKEAEAPLAFTQLIEAGVQLLCTFADPLLQRLIERLQLSLGPSSRLNLLLAFLIEPGIVDGDRGLRRDPRQDQLGSLGENAGIGVAEE